MTDTQVCLYFCIFCLTLMSILYMVTCVYIIPKMFIPKKHMVSALKQISNNVDSYKLANSSNWEKCARDIGHYCNSYIEKLERK